MIVMYPWWFATALFYFSTLGLWEIWRRRHFIALTNQRLLYGKGIVMAKTQRTVPLSRVQDATYDRRLWMGGVRISSAGGSFGTLHDVLFRPKDAKEFVRVLNESLPAGHDGLGAASAPKVSAPEIIQPSAVDAGEQLRKLQQLRDDGLITDAEYDAKRQAAVDQL